MNLSSKEKLLRIEKGRRNEHKQTWKRLAIRARTETEKMKFTET